MIRDESLPRTAQRSWLTKGALCAAVGFGLSAMAAVAQEAAPRGVAFIEAIGFDAQLHALGGQLGNPALTPPDLPEKAQNAMAIAVAAFDGDRLVDDMAVALDAILPDPARAEGYRFYRSPLGARMLALENDAMADMAALEDPVALGAAAEALAKSPDHGAIFDDMIVAMEAEAVSDAVGRSLLRSMLWGMLSAQNDGAPMEPESVEGMADQMWDSVGGQAIQMMPIQLMAIYEDATLDDLAAYRDWLETDDARELYAALSVAMLSVTEEAAGEYGRLFAEAMAADDT